MSLAFASSHGYCQRSWGLAKWAHMSGQPYNAAADLIDRNLIQRFKLRSAS
jgi:hypothetical protein